ncbi:MAG: cupin domain-containing protein [Chloroflexi bacterium]|nr:cupin domain-containing protein [Chloroflexota bacterium]
MEKLNTYQRWLAKEGLPIIKDYNVPDVMAVSLSPWPRKGGYGAYVSLVGSEEVTDCYLCEISPGGSLQPQKHLFEETIYILSGRGATTIWADGIAKQTFEWQEGSLFSPPLNTWHQHFNGQGDKPARYVAVTRAPVFMNLFHNLDFIFNNDYVFEDRYTGEAGFFGSQGKLLEASPTRSHELWETNFIPDCRSFRLDADPRGGEAISSAFFELSNNIMAIHIALQPVGTYKKAHYHGAGAHLLCLSGQGYSLMWPSEGGIMAEGVPRIRVDWRKNTIFSPPERWFHQHFITTSEPARMLAFHPEQSRKYEGIKRDVQAAKSVKLGGALIEYEDEDPAIRRLFKEELTKNGAPWYMSKYFPGE